MILRPLILPLLLAASSVGGSEDLADLALFENLGDVFQMRIGVGLQPAPTTYQETFKGYNGTQIGLEQHMKTSQARTGSLAFIRGRLNPIGFLAGVEGVYAYTAQETQDYTINQQTVKPAYPSHTKFSTFGGNLLFGGGLMLSRGLHCELLGLAGGGAGSLESSSPYTADSPRATGQYWNIGARSGLYQQMGKMLLGASASYTYGKMELKSYWFDGALEQSCTLGGLSGQLEFGFCF